MNAKTTPSASANEASSNYIDLHTRGMGYLSRVREVKPKKGHPFLAASINAFHGEKGGEMTYVKFDVRVSGGEADKVMRSQLMDVANDKDKKVVIGFNIGDIFIDTFTYEKGDKAGQQGTVLKGRLLRVYWANVDGNRAYTAESASDAAAGSA